MIRNYNELLICIRKAERQILALTLEKRTLILNLNFKKARAVLVQQQQLQLHIRDYIRSYKEKIKAHYLENKIYGHRLEDLKKGYQIKGNIVDFILCLQKLTDQYHVLLKDVVFFQRASQLDDVTAIEEKIKNILYQMEQLFSELGRIMLLPNFNPIQDQIAQYNSLTHFFSIYYTLKIQKLEYELQAKKQAIKTINYIFNHRSFKVRQAEIQHINNELKLLHPQKNNLKYLDRTKWEFIVI
jgi:hypothetical protein